MTRPAETWLRASCELSFEVTAPTPMVFMLRPRSNARQWVAAEEYQLAPCIHVKEYTDSFGNLCQRLVAPTGQFRLATRTDVLVTQAEPGSAADGFISVPDLPDHLLSYLLPSRYCEVDRLGQLAQQIVAGRTPGFDQVEAICDWVRTNVDYVPLSSMLPVSATEVIDRGEGVCRDLAHIAISLCRALCIPARMTVGYLHELDPMDIHAWFEAYVGNRWHTFDPTSPEGPGWRIVLACGRDAADVAIYNQYGPMLLPRDMQVSVETTNGP